MPEVFGLKNKSACNCGGELNYLPAVDGLDLGILLGAWNPPPLALAVVGSGQETVGSEELAAVSSQPLAPSPRLSASANLIDAALAWELLGSAPTEQAPSVERETGVEAETAVEAVFIESSNDYVWRAPLAHGDGEVDPATSGSDENEEHDQPWLDGEL